MLIVLLSSCLGSHKKEMGVGKFLMGIGEEFTKT